MKFLKGLGITVAALIVVAVLVLGYFGFVPGVSNLFGSNQPRDLGVTYSMADYNSAHAKNGTNHTIISGNPSPQDSIQFSGQHPVNTTYTQSEFNALINYRQWAYYPLKECQLKINPDGSLEFSGVVDVSRVKGYMQALNVSESDLKTVTDYLKYIPGDAAVYASGKFEIIDGRIVNSDITEFKVGKLDITGQLQNNLPSLVDAVYSQMDAYPGFSVKTLTFHNGEVQFQGTLPDSARSVGK
jgi:hypothetical protein